MKASCLYLTLGVVPLVICTPVPWLLQQPGGDALASPVIRFAPETSSVEGSQAVESAEAPRGFAPHRQSPIKAAQPSVLPPLSRHRPPAPTEKSETSEPDAAFAPYPAHDNSEPPDPVESQTAETPRSAIPCYQASSPCEQDDVLVVYFAAAFMLVVVVMETWRSVFGRQGAIRLESNAGPSQVSFRDTQDSGEPAQDEKRIESSVLDLQPGAGASSPLCRTSAA